MYDGTISAGGTWAPGWHGLGLSLSTGNEYAEVPHGSQIKGVNPFTVSVWLKPAEINRLQYLVKKARLNATIGDIPYDGYELGLEANGKPFFRINQVTSLDTYRLDAIQPVLLDEWTHVAATYDFSVARLYVDGVEVASGRFDVPVLGNPVRLGIGAECRFNTRCSPAAATNFKGILDEIRFLQTVLPARDIAILARRGPVISWSFDEDPLLTGGRARDESGACNDGELLDGADVLGIGCRPGHGGCLSLDGNTVSVDLDWDSRLEGSFTAAAWVQRNVSGTTNVISQSDEENGFAVGIDPNGYAFASVGAPPGGVAFSVTGLTPQAEGVWRHLAATFDGLSLSLYENGLLQAVVPAAGATLTSGVPLSLGSRTQGASPLTARMDDVRVYRRALALEEIADLP